MPDMTRAQGCTRCNGTGEYRGTRRDGSTYIGDCFTCQGGGFRRWPTRRPTSAPVHQGETVPNADMADRMAASVAPVVTASGTTITRLDRPTRNWQAFAAAFPMEADWLYVGAQRGDSFAESLQNGVRRYGNLTPRQLACVQRNLADAAANAAPVFPAAPVTGAPFYNAVANIATPVAPAIVIDVSRINTAMQAAAASGLIKVKLTLGAVTIKLGRTGRHARQNLEGFLLAYVDGAYAGKILAATGVFTVGRAGASDAAIAAIRAAVADPQAAAATHGHDTGHCACCGRFLSDPPSVMAGIGPVCIRRFGWSF